jgi:hypothetical protein
VESCEFALEGDPCLEIGDDCYSGGNECDSNWEITCGSDHRWYFDVPDASGCGGSF